MKYTGMLPEAIVAINLKRKILEDIKGVIIIRKLKRDRLRNGQRKNDKITNNDLQNTHIKLMIE